MLTVIMLYGIPVNAWNNRYTMATSTLHFNTLCTYTCFEVPFMYTSDQSIDSLNHIFSYNWDI